jgi:1-acyl-sn-glycerol-3-phosphate acyltransferase
MQRIEIVNPGPVLPARAELVTRLGLAGVAVDPPPGSRPPCGVVILLCAPPFVERTPELALLEATVVRLREPRPLVLLSSAAIYEPRMDHPGMIAEISAERLRCPGSLAGALRRLELAAINACRSRGVRLTILRPAPVLVPGGRDLFHRLVGPGVAFTDPGFDPNLQLLWIDDLVSAVAKVVTSRLGADSVLSGLFHLAPVQTVPAREAARRGAGFRVPYPPALRWRARHRGQGAADWPLSVLRYAFTISADKARAELDWRPEASSAAAIDRLGDALSSSGVKRFRRRLRAVDAVVEANVDPEYDDHGLDPELCQMLSRTIWRFAHDVWWRVETSGLEHVPLEGPVVLSGIHRGYMPFDAVMLLHLLRRERGRTPRFLIHPALLKPPFIASLIAKMGGVVASQSNADRLLERGEVVGVLPEGVRGAFAEYRDVYRLRRFGRSDFVRIALRGRCPIVPFVMLGPAESLPIWKLWKWHWWMKTMGWPGLPIGPLAPLPVPLPTKWHALFLPPLHLEKEYPASAAEDRDAVREIAERFRGQLEQQLAVLLAARRSWWRGSILGPGTIAP